uniref:Uncharacterized protein n=1 Tax=Anguilla anguilla TaxID=7936 RepID=A0A0E9XBR4_ANGAN
MVHPSVAKCLLLRLVSLYFNELPPLKTTRKLISRNTSTADSTD